MLDNYFSTGNVYIIDDQKSEAFPLIDSLYKHQIPHVYMDGTAGKLPKNPKQVRLIFLDLNLRQGANPLDKKSFKNNHAGILNKLLANNSSSYIILVWSKEEKNYLGDFKEIFKATDDEYNLNSRPPLDIISLEKSSFFESSLDEGGLVNYNWKKGQETALYTLIKDKLIINEAFKTLSSWENLISNSGSQAVDNLFDLVKGKTTKEMNSKLSEIISSLSISFMGTDKFLKSKNQDRTDAFMLALSELIDDEIDNEIILKKQPEFNNWSTTRINSVDKGKLNSKLLTSIEISKNKLTGSVFKGDKTHNYLKMFTDCIDQNRKAFKKKYNVAKTEIKELKEKDFKTTLAKELVKDPSKFIPIEINLTPLCDVVQNKEEYYRIVPGFLIDAVSMDLLYTNTDRNYFSPLLYHNSGIKECIIVLDFRYLFTIKEKEIKERSKLCSLRKSFVDEIQSKLANHVSRLGILYLP
jgi:hypothetical protein